MPKNKNKYGQYFTPCDIAEFMVLLITHDKSSIVLEPSAGEGVFIKQLNKHGFNNVVGYEIDKTLSYIDCIKYESFISSPQTEKYDIVIGNPPYIRWKNLENELKQELYNNALWTKYFNSLCDYLFIFILKSILQLNENGELIFICPEYWISTTYSKSLRDYMSCNGYISDVYRFKETALFKGVSASFIIFRYIKTSTITQKTINLYSYNRRDKPLYDELISKRCFTLLSIPQFKYGGKWVLAGKNEIGCIEYFEKSCIKNDIGILFDGSNTTVKIGDICDIGNGMVSGLDKAFVVDNFEKLNDFEKVNTIKVHKAKDLDRFFAVSDCRYIYFNENLSEREFANKCPHFYSQLLTYKDRLKSRYNYGRNIPIWEFTFKRNNRLFFTNKRRIFVPCKERISHKDYFRFSLVNNDMIPLQDVTAIFLKDSCCESIEYVLAFLNSQYVFMWLKYNGIVKGNIVEFSERPISQIPYRKINWGNKSEVKLHDEIVRLTRVYIQTKDINIIFDINDCFKRLM